MNLLNILKKNLVYKLIIFLFVTQFVYSQGHIIVFHRVGDDRYPSTNINTEDLEAVLKYLKTNDYSVVKVEKIIKFIKEGKEIPKKTIAISVDDAYESFYTNGLKLFKKYKYPFTLFVNTEAVNRRFGDYMTWAELKEVSKYGEIGSHSYAHKHMTKLSLADAYKDVKRSVDDIKKQLEITPRYFSYPYGEYTKKLKEKFKTLKFEAIFNQNPGAISKESDIFDLNRIAIDNAKTLKSKLRVDFLKGTWTLDTENKKLKKLSFKTKEDVLKGELYISGYGWERINLDKGNFVKAYDLKLKFSRNRLIFRTYKHEYSIHILVN